MKSIEQAAQEYAVRNTVNTGADRTKRENAFKAGIDFAQKWISVEDELPEECKNILVNCMNGKRNQHDVDFLINGKFQKRKNVTHWRPIELT